MDYTKVESIYNERIDKMYEVERCEKKDIRNALIMLRFLIRGLMAVRNEVKGKERYFIRQKRIMEKRGLAIPILEAKVKQYSDSYKVTNDCLISYGRALQNLLDLWEIAGATNDDLFDLCGGGQYLKGWKRARLQEESDMSLAKIVFVYNVDYPDDGNDFITEETDAPFTHAMKEYMLDIMLNTKRGRKASHEAMMAVFPDLMEKALMVQEDDFGQKGLYDNEGNLVYLISDEA